MPIDFSGISDRTLLGRALRAPLELIPPSAVVPVVQGPLRGARWVVGSATHGCWLGSYERHKAETFASLIREGMIVFDVGAHVGYYSLIASRRLHDAGRVFAFEPIERNLRYLRRHLSMNHASNVTVLDVAVSTGPGGARFDPGPDSHRGRVDPSGSLRVETVSLDDLIAGEEVPSPDLLKVDIEGGEVDALRGASAMLREARPLILLATHGPSAHSACLSILDRAGYSIGVIGDGPDELLARPRK